VIERSESSAIAGNLRMMPFPDVMQWLSASGKTGTLVIDGPQYTKRLMFKRGWLTAASSDNPREMMGYYLVGWSHLTEEQLESLIEMQAEVKVVLGELATRMELLSEEELNHVLRVKTEETLFDLMTWEEGNFRFLEGELSERGYRDVVKIPVERLLLEGHRQRDERRRMAELIPDGRHIPALIGEPEKGSLSERDLAIANAVDDRRSIEEIARICRVPKFTIFSFTFRGLHSGLLALYPPAGDEQMTPGLSDAPWHQAARQIEDLLQRGRFLDSLHLVAELDQKYGDHQEVRALVARLEEGIGHRLDEGPLQLDGVLEPAIELDELFRLDCAPAEGFVLSRVNGSYTIQEVLAQLPGTDLYNRVLLHNLLRRGLVRLKDTGSMRPYTPDPVNDEPE